MGVDRRDVTRARSCSRDVITQVADDLHDAFVLGLPPPADRYPAEEEADDDG
jgi:hypothetical protein